MTSSNSDESEIKKIRLTQQLALKRHSDSINQKERIDTKALALAGIIGTVLVLHMGFTPIILSATAGSFFLPIIIGLLIGVIILSIALILAIYAASPYRYFLSPNVRDMKERLNEFSYSQLLEYLADALVTDIEDNQKRCDKKAPCLRLAFILAAIGFLFSVAIVFLLVLSYIPLPLL